MHQPMATDVGMMDASDSMRTPGIGASMKPHHTCNVRKSILLLQYIRFNGKIVL